MHADLPPDVRYDGIGHAIIDASQGRCVRCKRVAAISVASVTFDFT